MRRAVFAFGVLLILAGIFWALQGGGIVMWPAESFMLQQKSWITYGIVTALVGVVLVGLSRRLR